MCLNSGKEKHLWNRARRGQGIGSTTFLDADFINTCPSNLQMAQKVGIGSCMYTVDEIQSVFL